MTTPRKTYSPSLKAEVVREICGETRAISQIAAQYGIHPNQLYTWRDQAAAALPDLFTDQAAQTLAEQQAARTAEAAPRGTCLLGDGTTQSVKHVSRSELTCVGAPCAWLYLVALLDRHSRYIVRWELDKTMAVGLVGAALERALVGATPKICNSD